MPTRIYHLEYTFDGETTHSYYTSLTALCIDNEGTFGLPSIHTLQRVKEWPYDRTETYGGHKARIVIRKSHAYGTGAVRRQDEEEEEE